MTLFFCDSFDGLSTGAPNTLTNKWDLFTGAWGGFFSATPARTGTNAVRATATTGGAVGHICSSTEQDDTMIVGVAWRFLDWASSGGGRQHFQFWSDWPAAPTQHVTVSVGYDGSISAYRGNLSGTLLGTSAAGVVPKSAYCYIEVKTKLHATTGFVTIKVNESVVLDVQSINTKNGGTKTVFDHIRLDFTDPTNSTYVMIDDVYMANKQGTVNNDFLGAISVIVLRPTSDGAHLDFTPTPAGTHYTTVDDQASSVDTTDYVTGSAIGNTDTYGHDDLTIVATSQVKAVMVNVNAALVGAGSGNLKGVGRAAGVDSIGTAMPIGVTNPTTICLPIEKDPSNAAWTVAEVNAGEFGFQVA